jgi:hypothetical protein
VALKPDEVLQKGAPPAVTGTKVMLAQLQVANDHPGVNSNLLNPAHLIDVPSGTQVVNGVPCRVRIRP